MAKRSLLVIINIMAGSITGTMLARFTPLWVQIPVVIACIWWLAKYVCDRED